jgi:peptide/nickel transport system permease protein
VAGFCGVLLVRFAPGFGTDDRELNAHLSEESINALRAGRDANVIKIYGRFLADAVHGDLGTSESLNAPVAELLRERLPLTMRSAGLGLALAWAAALLIATVADWTGTAATEVLLAAPAGLIALLLFVALDGSAAVPGIGIALVVFPHLYRNQRMLLGEAAGRPHVLSAHARGVTPLRVFLREVLPGALPQLLALAGTSVTLAVGAAIPIETICDSPGIGQLAWKAATARDLGLLLPLILAVTAITLMANFTADLAIGGRKVAS